MTWTPLHRFVHLGRRPRGHAATVPDPAGAARASRRDPAMAGFDVTPSHGRHCICRRCEQLSRLAD